MELKASLRIFDHREIREGRSFVVTMVLIASIAVATAASIAVVITDCKASAIANRLATASVVTLHQIGSINLLRLGCHKVKYC